MRGYLKFLLIKSIFLFLILFSSCLENSGGGGSIPNTNNPEELVNYLVYKANDYVYKLVDPRTDSIVNFENKPIQYFRIFYNSNGDKFAFYLTEEDGDLNIVNGGKLIFISLKKGVDNFGKKQITNFNNVCFINTHYINKNNQYFSIETAGTDNECFTRDDEYYIVATQLGNNTRLIQSNENYYLFHVLEDNSGNLEGFIIKDTSNKKLLKCNFDLSLCDTITNYSNDLITLYDEDNNTVYLCVDNQFKKYDLGTNLLEDITTTTCDSPLYSSGDNVFYWTKSNNKFKLVKYSKSNNIVTVFNDEFNDLLNFPIAPRIVGDTNNFLLADMVYSINNTSYTYSHSVAINKETGGYVVLKEDRKTQSFITHTFKDKVFFIVLDFNIGKPWVCFWLENTNLSNCEMGYKWIGTVFNKDNSVNKLVLLKDYKDIYVLDPNDTEFNNLEKVVSLPTGYTDIVHNITVVDSKKFLIFVVDPNIPKGEIFLVDLNRKTIKQITNTGILDKRALN